jgi:hypothetical protein
MSIGSLAQIPALGMLEAKTETFVTICDVTGRYFFFATIG